MIAKIISLERIASNVFDMRAESDTEVRPGQFFHIKCRNKILRRPVSVCEQKDGLLRFVFETKGEGTLWLSERRKSDYLDILGPLGNGFPAPEGKVLLAGGGLGAAPLLMCADTFDCDAALGFRSAENLILGFDFLNACSAVRFATDDGSLGFHGNSVSLAEEMLGRKNYSAIYACGPRIMLRSVKELALKTGLKCFVSLEERMGCGVGACLVCACKVKREGSETYARVCADGPVFDAREVVFDD